MGWQATGWAFNAPIENAGCKFVLVALAERAGNENDESPTWECHPSIETIRKYTSQGYRTIQRHLDWLEANGYISRVARMQSKGRRGCYNFTLHKVPVMATGQNGHRPETGVEPAQIGQTEPVKGTDHQKEGSTRGSRLPTNWEPNIDCATLIGLSESEARREGERFRDYWLGVPGERGRKVDWDATWRNWCRKRTEESPRGRGTPASPSGLSRRAENAIAGLMEAPDPRRGRWRI